MKVVPKLHVSITETVHRVEWTVYLWWEHSSLSVTRQAITGLNSAMVLQDTAGVWTIGGRREQEPAPHLVLHLPTVTHQVNMPDTWLLLIESYCCRGFTSIFGTLEIYNPYHSLFNANICLKGNTVHFSLWEPLSEWPRIEPWGTPLAQKLIQCKLIQYNCLSSILILGYWFLHGLLMWKPVTSVGLWVLWFPPTLKYMLIDGLETLNCPCLWMSALICVCLCV